MDLITTFSEDLLAGDPSLREDLLPENFEKERRGLVESREGGLAANPSRVVSELPQQNLPTTSHNKSVKLESASRRTACKIILLILTHIW